MPSSSLPGTLRRTTLAPVASSAWPKPTSSRVESFAVRAWRSSLVTDVRASASIALSAYHVASSMAAPARVSTPRR